MTIEIGAEAPDFTLADTDKSEVTLSSYRGKKSVTLVFIRNKTSKALKSATCSKPPSPT